MIRIKPFVLPLLLMAMIFLVSSLPGGPESGTFNFMLNLKPTVQNALHVPVFGILQWLWLRALEKAGRVGFSAMFAAIGITFSYGVLDEFHQMFVPGRYASLTDVALDLLGIVIGTGLFVSFRRLNPLKKDKVSF